ncbi:MAG: PHP domain-containing protein [Desulfobacula sp.]|nr:PHP domain-containing protein [Desulfobacula sp.]
MNQKIFADLHNHTTDSDGDFTSEQLLERAKSLEIKAVGITNHDTIKGLKSAIKAGGKCDIEVIPGVEVSVRFKETGFTGTLHLLCYFKPERLLDDSFVNQMTQVLSRGRGESLVKARVYQINLFFGPGGKTPMLKRPLTFEDISALSDNASRRHFAFALNQTFGITDKDAVNAIIGNNSPAYLPSGIDFDLAMNLVKEQQLLCVLAHPAAGSFPGKGHYKEVLPPINVVEQFLPRFLAAGLHGLEVRYPGHIKDHEDLVLSWAVKHQLLVTGGSDTHDAIDRPIGVRGIDESQYKIFKAALI